MSPAEQTASTLPAPSFECRCREPLAWLDWIQPRTWLDADGREIESRTCPQCGCTRSVVRVQS